MLKIGITNSAYLLRYGIEDGCKKMVEHGYSCIDYNNFIDTETDFFRLPEKEFEKNIKEENKIIKSNGLYIHQTHGPWRYPPRDYTKEDREERFASMSKGIRGTAYAESEFFVIHPIMPFGPNSPDNPEEVMEINLDFMGRLAQVGKEYGVTVCFENMPFPNHPIARVCDIKSFVEKINSKYFKICLDTGHCLVCGQQPADAVRETGKDLLAVMHVHDNNGVNDQHKLLYNGIADWKDFGKALKEIKFEGVFSYETSVGNDVIGDQREAKEKEMIEIAKNIIEI